MDSAPSQCATPPKVAKARSKKVLARKTEKTEPVCDTYATSSCARSVGEVLIVESTPTCSREIGGREALPRRTPVWLRRHTLISDNHHDPWYRRRMQCFRSTQFQRRAGDKAPDW